MRYFASTTRNTRAPDRPCRCLEVGTIPSLRLASSNDCFCQNRAFSADRPAAIYEQDWPFVLWRVPGSHCVEGKPWFSQRLKLPRTQKTPFVPLPALLNSGRPVIDAPSVCRGYRTIGRQSRTIGILDGHPEGPDHALANPAGFAQWFDGRCKSGVLDKPSARNAP